MKVITDSKQFVLVFGLPRSGTTIICEYLNSLDNGFCISEPILGTNLNPKMVTWDKIPPCSKLKSDLIIEHCESVLESFDEFDLGGIKEIWTPLHRSCGIDAVRSGRFNKILFILRDPIDVFASWKSTTWGRQITDDKQGTISFNDHNWLCYAYEQYLNLIKEYKKSEILFYNDFVEDPKKSLRECGINIVGEENMQPSEYKFGDMKARKSTKIEKQKSKRYLLNDHNIKEIKNDSIYQEFIRIQKERNKVW